MYLILRYKLQKSLQQHFKVSIFHVPTAPTFIKMVASPQQSLAHLANGLNCLNYKPGSSDLSQVCFLKAQTWDAGTGAWPWTVKAWEGRALFLNHLSRGSSWLSAREHSIHFTTKTHRWWTHRAITHSILIFHKTLVERWCKSMQNQSCVTALAEVKRKQSATSKAILGYLNSWNATFRLKSGLGLPAWALKALLDAKRGPARVRVKTNDQQAGPV